MKGMKAKRIRFKIGSLWESPLLCTDPDMIAKKALLAYKYQPRLEKRFTQFKSIHKAAPLLFKKIERVEGIMFLFFVALMLQAIIEREVRHKMKDKNIHALLHTH